MVRGIQSPVTGSCPDSMIWLEPLNTTDAPVVLEGTDGPAIVIAVPRTNGLGVIYADPSHSTIFPTVMGGFEKSRPSLTETVQVEEMDETFRIMEVELILVVPGVNIQLEILGPSTEISISAAETGMVHSSTRTSSTGITSPTTRDG